MNSLPQNQTSGSTVVVLLGGEHHCVFMWTGDSRLYRLRARQLNQLTTEYTQADLYIKRGLISLGSTTNHPSKNIVTFAVGVPASLYLDLDIVEALSGDRFLFSLDGLDKHVSDTKVEPVRQDAESKTIVGTLAELTPSRGAIDNATVCSMNARQIGDLQCPFGLH